MTFVVKKVVKNVVKKVVKKVVNKVRKVVKKVVKKVVRLFETLFWSRGYRFFKNTNWCLMKHYENQNNCGPRWASYS